MDCLNTISQTLFGSPCSMLALRSGLKDYLVEQIDINGTAGRCASASSNVPIAEYSTVQRINDE